MKTQFLSTLTQQTAWGLFFLTLINLKGSKAGNAFRNCLNNNVPSGSIIYDNMIKYASNKDFSIWNDFCCDVNGCLPDNGYCGISAIPFGCKVSIGNQNPSCFPTDYRSTLSKSKCAGMIGDIPGVRGNIAFLNYLSTLTPTGLDKGYALYNFTSCPTTDCGGLKYCGWDNNGVICYGEVNATFDSIGSHFPLSWPGPANLNPFNTTPSITTSIPVNQIMTTTETISTATSTPPTLFELHSVSNIATNNLVGNFIMLISIITSILNFFL